MQRSSKLDTSHKLIDVSELEGPLQLVEQFKTLYQTLNASNCQSYIVDDDYRRDVLFQDSFPVIEGLGALKEYYNELYLK